MVFVKIDTDFIDINELSIASSVPVEQIEEFLNKGLLNDIDIVRKCYPNQISSIRKIRLAAGLQKLNLHPYKNRDLMFCLNDDNQLNVQNTLQSFGLSEEDSDKVLSYMRNINA